MKLFSLVAVAALVACGPNGSKAPEPADEYDLVKEQYESDLASGPMPISKAMAELASKDRAEFAELTPKPSEDESALNGWSFAGAVAVAAGDVTMPAECQGAPDPMACWGEKLSNSKGCMACHAIDGQRQQPCPNWLGLFGKERPLTSGETVVADEAYLANSIINSWDQVVEGYGKAMPPYNFPEQEVDALVAYIKSLGEGG
jgi:hypothetical protein